MSMRFVAAIQVLARLLCVAGIVLTSACGARGPGSPYVTPPADPERESIDARLTELLKDSKVSLGTRPEYVIGPGDVLGFSLVGRPELLSNDRDKGDKYTVVVTENPLISLPMIGAIKVHGKTPMELEKELKVAYGAFITNPVPVVTIDRFYRNQVTVLGSVRSPGKYPLEAGDTLLESIFRAGGLTFGRDSGGPAPGRYLKIYREKLTQREKADLSPEDLMQKLTEGDKVVPREEIIVPIDALILHGEMQYNLPVMPNDLVFVPPAGAVIVNGRCRNPGVVFLGPALRTVTAVLTERGGPRFSGTSRIEVVRTNSDGSQQSFYMDMRKMKRRTAEDFLLQDGDQVFIYSTPARDVLEWIGNIFRGSAVTGLNATYAPI